MPKEALESISLGEEMPFMDPKCPLTSEAPSCLLSWKTVFKRSHKKCWLSLLSRLSSVVRAASTPSHCIAC